MEDQLTTITQIRTKKMMRNNRTMRTKNKNNKMQNNQQSCKIHRWNNFDQVYVVFLVKVNIIINIDIIKYINYIN